MFNSQNLLNLLQYRVFLSTLSIAYAKDLRSNWPWNDIDDVDYILNTYGNDPFYFKISGLSGQDLVDHGFNPAHKTAFVVHGWVQSGESYCDEFKDGNAYEIFQL